MAKLSTVNPTRQELLKLRKRLKTAQSGHKLLKDKLESLMREFLERISRLKENKEYLEERLPIFYRAFFRAQSELGQSRSSSILSHIPDARLGVRVSSMMGVRGLNYELDNLDEISKAPFPKIASTADMDEARRESIDILAALMEYASLEQQLRSLAEEIEKTRRRVNALEYVFIPELLKTRKFISHKLEESERMSRTVLMKLKSQLR